MTKLIGLILLLPALLASFSAQSATTSEKLAICVLDSLNGKERKQLIQWAFFSISVHPDISSYFNVTNEDIESKNQNVGELMTRLITEDCPTESKVAYDTDPLAAKKAFETAGKVATQELIMNKKVEQTMSGFMKYVDLEKIGKVLNGK